MKNGLIIDDDGTQRWYRDDKRHRENDLPAVIDTDGSQSWCRHGKTHRENGLPAIIWADGQQEWYRHGQWHRENGPAVINADGSSWWRHGNFIDVEKWIEDNNLPSWETWDDVTWSLFRLEFM